MLSSFMMAVNAYNPENYVQFDEYMFCSNGSNPETALIQKDAFEKCLSEDAKKAIQDIMDMPENFFKNSVRERELGWSKVQKYMQTELHYRYKDTQKIKKEIKRWLKNQ